MQKVARNEKSCSKYESCQKVSEQLVESPKSSFKHQGNSLKQLIPTVHGPIFGSLIIIGRLFAFEMCVGACWGRGGGGGLFPGGLIFRGACYRITGSDDILLNHMRNVNLEVFFSLRTEGTMKSGTFLLAR